MFMLLLVVKIEKQRDDDDDMLLFPSFVSFRCASFVVKKVSTKNAYSRVRVKMGFVNKFQCDDKLKQLSILFLLVKQGESINQSINQSINRRPREWKQSGLIQRYRSRRPNRKHSRKTGKHTSVVVVVATATVILSVVAIAITSVVFEL